MSPDRDLVAAAAAGDTEAFKRLMERYGPAVSALLHGKVEPRDEEDLLQEVFLAAYQRIGRLRNGKALWPWLRRIASNKVSDHWRRTYRERRLFPGRGVDDAAENVPGKAPTPSEAAGRADDLRRLEEALAGLKENLRIVVYLHLWEEETVAHIAALLGIRETAVRMRLHRGLRRLRDRLTATGFREE